MTPDLQGFLGRAIEPAGQPDWLTAQLREALPTLSEAQTKEAWMGGVGALREAAETWIATGRLTGGTAVATLCLVDILEAAWTAEGRAGTGIVLGFAMQLTLSGDDWRRDTGGKGGDDAHDRPLRLGSLPGQLVDHLVKRGRLSMLREMVRLLHAPIDGLARKATREAHDFDEWIGALAILAAHLVKRRWLPLKIPENAAEPGRIELLAGETDELVGGRFVAPPQQDAPMLARLFDDAAIRDMHREEAYAAECFAHLYASFRAERLTRAHQDEMQAEYRRRLAQSSLDARQWAALGKSRFELAPYVTA